jgi:hypothetical protein
MRAKYARELDDEISMASISELDFFLGGLGGVVMVYVMLKSIGQCAVAAASGEIRTRRAEEAQRHAEDAAAEAAGLAAALEPLALKADGSIEDPILAEAEVR